MNSRKIFKSILVNCVILFLTGSFSCTSPAEQKATDPFLKSYKIADLPESVSDYFVDRLNSYSAESHIHVNAPHRVVAYPSEGKQNYEMNGKKMNQKKYDDVGFPILSPDGKTLIFMGLRNGKQYLVVNGRESKGFDEIFLPRYDQERAKQLSPAGDSYLYLACDHRKEGFPILKKCFVIIGDLHRDKIFTPPEWVEDERQVKDLQWSPSGKKFYYILRNPKERASFLYLDGKLGKPFHFVAGPYFDQNEKSVKFVGEWRRKHVWVSNDQTVGKAYDTIHCTSLSFPTGLPLCLGLREEQWFLLEEGKEKRKIKDGASLDRVALAKLKEYIPPPKSEKTSTLPFSISERTVQKGSEILHEYKINGKTYGPFFMVHQEQISPDGLHFAVEVEEKKGEESEHFYIIDGKEETKFSNRVRGFTFSPDSQHWMYIGTDEKKSGKYAPTFLMKDGKKEEIEKVLANTFIIPYFSPDSKKVILWYRFTKYYACPKSITQYEGQVCMSPFSNFTIDGRLDNDKMFVLLDQDPQFSPDGKKMGYLALKKNELWWVVKDL